jgi:hypothetical protein
MQQNVEMPTASACPAAPTSGFQAALKGPMILSNFEGQLENPGVSVPLVLKGL